MKRKRLLVVLETPFAASGFHTVAEHIAYAKVCMLDCLIRGEAPIASHLLWTQERMLDDTVPLQRWAGMQAGLAWYEVADRCVVYDDLGISNGMQPGINRAVEHKVTVEYRHLPENVRSDLAALAGEWWDTPFNGWFDRSYPAELRPASGGVVPAGKGYRVGSGGIETLGADFAARAAKGERG